jgi:hypothetical protein
VLADLGLEDGMAQRRQQGHARALHAAVAEEPLAQGAARLLLDHEHEAARGALEVDHGVRARPRDAGHAEERELSGREVEGPVEALLGTVADGVWTERKWMDPVTENLAVGATEVWEIYNTTVDAHPMHIHEIAFEVVNREGLILNAEGEVAEPILLDGNITAPEPWESGFKDTVIAYPGQVTRLKDGHQTQILTTLEDLPAVEVAVRMFDRWRQENFFKYMREEYALDALDALVDYAVEPDDPDRGVPNPARKAVDAELRDARAALSRLLASYGDKAISNPEAVRRTMRGFKIANGKLGKAAREAMKRVAEVEAHSLRRCADSPGYLPRCPFG